MTKLIERRNAIENIVVQHCSLHRDTIDTMLHLETIIGRMKGRLGDVESAEREIAGNRLYVCDNDSWCGDRHYYAVSSSVAKVAGRALRAKIAHQRQRIKAMEAKLGDARSRFYETLYPQFEGLWGITKTTKQAAHDVVEQRIKLRRRGVQI